MWKVEWRLITENKYFKIFKGLFSCHKDQGLNSEILKSIRQIFEPINNLWAASDVKEFYLTNHKYNKISIGENLPESWQQRNFFVLAGEVISDRRQWA